MNKGIVKCFLNMVETVDKNELSRFITKGRLFDDLPYKRGKYKYIEAEAFANLFDVTLYFGNKVEVYFYPFGERVLQAEYNPELSTWSVEPSIYCDRLSDSVMLASKLRALLV